VNKCGLKYDGSGRHAAAAKAQNWRIASHDRGKLIGIVTTTDVLKAFLHIVETGRTRSDVDAEAGGI
jgi:CBS domain-containing protein